MIRDQLATDLLCPKCRFRFDPLKKEMLYTFPVTGRKKKTRKGRVMGDYDRIIEEIKKGLTGDAGHDTAYLVKMSGTYREHPLGREIIKECMRMLYGYFPDENKKKIGDAFEEDTKADRKTVEEIKKLVAERNFGEALFKAEALAKKADIFPLFREDEASRYYDTAEPFEEDLCEYTQKGEKKMRAAGWCFRDAYFGHGLLLVEHKRLREAEEELKKALYWDPANTDVIYELAEVYKMRGDMEKFLELTEAATGYAFRPHSFARCLRNYGYYFIEKNEWAAAEACYRLSLAYEEENGNAGRELAYISCMTGGRLMDPSPEDVKELSEKFGFPFRPKDYIIEIPIECGTYYFEQGKYEQAEYYLSIADGLADIPEVKEMLEEIRKRTGALVAKSQNQRR